MCNQSNNGAHTPSVQASGWQQSASLRHAPQRPSMQAFDAAQPLQSWHWGGGSSGGVQSSPRRTIARS
jgi:hypothetical protein